MLKLRILIIVTLTLFVLSSCSSGNNISEDEIRLSAHKLYYLAEQYYPSNELYFSEETNHIVTMYDLKTDNYCAYDYIYHEGFIFNRKFSDNNCIQPNYIIKGTSLINNNIKFYYDNFSVYGKENYTRKDHYSTLLIYYFVNKTQANDFITLLEQNIDEYYKDNFYLVKSYDDPEIISTDGIQSYYDYFFYINGIPNFIDFEEDISLFHLMILQRENYVYVHKIFLDDSIIQLRLYHLTGRLPDW